VKRLAGDRSRWKSFMEALCSYTGDNRKWWWMTNALDTGGTTAWPWTHLCNPADMCLEQKGHSCFIVIKSQKRLHSSRDSNIISRREKSSVTSLYPLPALICWCLRVAL
jgi:hypothetical protein